jgi:hypothetical protein
VRPEASAFLGKAREFLLKAEDMFADGWPDEAGRAAYLAAGQQIHHRRFTRE